MSAFICSDRQITTIVRFFAIHAVINADDIQPMADLLKRENIRSVNYRYSERARLLPCDVSSFSAEHMTPGHVLALAACLAYQSGERPDYARSKAAALLRRIRLFIADRFGTVETSVWSI